MITHRHKLRGWKAVAVVILSPVLFFGLLELFFAVTGLFSPLRLLEIREHDGRKYFATNPEYGRLFLQRSDVPAPPALWTPVDKPPGTRRVVMLGESAAAGYPMTDHHLGRLVQARWRARFPDVPVEVINLSMVAVNSHALREFAREALALDPDMFVVYAGHNEAIGPFGPAAKLGPSISSPTVARLALAVRRTRVGRAMESAIGAVIPSSVASGEWRGLDEFRGVRVAHDDPAMVGMLRNTEENFRAITRMALDHGAKVLFCLPATNLDDWPPMASEEPDAGGVEALLTAQETGDIGGFRSAALVYEAAQKRREAGDWQRALPLYRRAADLDLLVTEPGGEKCSYKRRFTANGGRLVREDGVSEAPASKHYESYVCHTAPPGDYELAVRFVLGKAVAGTATLEIIQHKGTASEKRTTKKIILAKEDVVIKTTLANGRAVVKQN